MSMLLLSIYPSCAHACAHGKRVSLSREPTKCWSVTWCVFEARLTTDCTVTRCVFSPRTCGILRMQRDKTRRLLSSCYRGV